MMMPKLQHSAIASRHPSDDGRTKLSARVLLSGAFALVIVLTVAGFSLYWVGELSVEVFVQTTRSWGMWGILGSVALMMVHSFIPFPAELLACANGMIYGPVWGTVITWTGAMLGSVPAFGLARRLGRPFVERMIAVRDWEILDDWAAKNGWQVVLIGRFIPVIAFNLINYAAGLTRLTLWQFIWTTGIGILPMTVLMVVMGDNIESLGWESWLLLLIGGLFLWFVFHRKLRGQL
jgi:uncharacterized membrane protein YdjX (TVP38/TMEM64 family)